MRCLLEAMHGCLLPPAGPSAKKAPPMAHRLAETFVHQAFGGYLRSQVGGMSRDSGLLWVYLRSQVGGMGCDGEPVALCRSAECSFTWCSLGCFRCSARRAFFLPGVPGVLQVQCTECSFCSRTYDPFLDVSLDILKATSVHRALQRFTMPEALDGAEKYRCRCHSAPSHPHPTPPPPHPPSLLPLPSHSPARQHTLLLPLCASSCCSSGCLLS